MSGYMTSWLRVGFSESAKPVVTYIYAFFEFDVLVIFGVFLARCPLHIFSSLRFDGILVSIHSVGLRVHSIRSV